MCAELRRLLTDLSIVTAGIAIGRVEEMAVKRRVGASFSLGSIEKTKL